MTREPRPARRRRADPRRARAAARDSHPPPGAAGDAGALFAAARAQAVQGLWRETEETLRAALALAPRSAEMQLNLGTALFHQERYADAERSFRAALVLEPGLAEAQNQLGAVLQTADRFEEAEAHLRQALAAAPGHAGAWCNLGNALRAQERFEAALECYAEALRLRPDFVDAQWNRALALLSCGRWGEGWRAYGWRFRAIVGPLPAFPLPLWKGEPGGGRRILIYGEQGVGDEIMFASCLPDLLARGIKPVLVCEPRLAPLFARSFPALEVHGTRRGQGLADGAGIEALDGWIPMGSLPLVLRPSEGAFPSIRGYLKAAPALERRYAAELTDALGSTLKVGIAWRGGRGAKERQRRSTDLAAWAPLAAVTGVSLIDLQYGDTAEERRRTEREAGMRLWRHPEIDARADLDRLAALTAALDLVIAVDSAAVHLAAALGRPVWALIPRPPDWRWLCGRGDSPWYPTARLYRQRRAGEWEPVFAALAADLARITPARTAAASGAEGPAPAD